jgi:chromosome segregation ATPase
MTNHELSSKVSKLQEEINGNVKRLKKLNDDLESIEEKQTIIDTLQIEVDQNVLKIKEITIGIKTLNLENEEMDKIILDKEDIIESLSQELCRVKAESAENKRNSNTIPPECLELYQENQELKAKLKEMETEHINYTQQLVDCLEMLKVQLVKERSEGNDFRSVGESANDLDSNESIELEKNRIKELQEELRIARRQLELMRSSRVENTGVRSRRGEMPDKKKCQVF